MQHCISGCAKYNTKGLWFMKKAFTGFLSCFFALSAIFTSLVFAPVSAEGSGGVKFGVMSDLHFHDGAYKACE